MMYSIDDYLTGFVLFKNNILKLLVPSITL